jgi:hypothetical protein
MAPWARWCPTAGVRLIPQPTLHKPVALSILSTTSYFSPESVSKVIVCPKSLLRSILPILRTRQHHQVLRS